MKKNEEFQSRLKNARYEFIEKEDYIKCLRELRIAGDMVLKEIKNEKEKKMENSQNKLIV